MDYCENFYGHGKSHFEERGCGYTAYEIAHQPAMWRELTSVLADNKEAIVNFMTPLMAKKPRIITTGAGSSGFVGRAVAGFSGKMCEGIHTTDIVSSPDIYLFSDVPTLLISFARSGNSPESVGAVEYARAIVSDLYEVAIVCDGSSKLATAAKEAAGGKGLVLVMPEGTNDNGFAMTSSVSTMMLAGYALLNWKRN